MKSVSEMGLAEVTLAILGAAVNIPDGLYARAKYLASQELRALLDAKRCDSCDDSGDLIDLTGEWRGYCVCPIGVALKNKPAAQPQGDPVAWQYRVSAGPQTGWSLWHDGKGEEFKQSYQVETRPLYAEQPAPLAVNSRAMTELRDIFDSNKGADGTLVISKKLAAQILGTK